MIKNNPVTIDDVVIAESIFGPDVGLLKGKTVRTKMPEAKQDIVEIPKAQIKMHKNAMHRYYESLWTVVSNHNLQAFDVSHSILVT